jgi:hypothetical protein
MSVRTMSLTWQACRAVMFLPSMTERSNEKPTVLERNLRRALLGETSAAH